MNQQKCKNKISGTYGFQKEVRIPLERHSSYLDILNTIKVEPTPEDPLSEPLQLDDFSEPELPWENDSNVANLEQMDPLIVKNEDEEKLDTKEGSIRFSLGSNIPSRYGQFYLIFMDPQMIN